MEMKKKVLLLFSIGYCLSTLGWAQFNRLRFGHVGVEDGLSQGSVYAIMQDSYGYLWIGTKDGLNRYDGYNIKRFKHDQFDSTSIAGNWIRAIYEDFEGNVWIGTSDGLSKFNRSKENFINYYFKDEKGETNSSIVYIWSISQDKDGYLWAGTNGAGAIRMDIHTGSYTRYKSVPENPDSLNGPNVRTLFRDSYGELWIGTEHQLHKYNRKTKSFQRFPINKTQEYLADGTTDGRIYAIFEDSKKRIWIGTGNGLNRLDRDGFFRRYRSGTDPHHLSSPTVTGIAEDREGNIWITTHYGLNRFIEQSETFISYHVSNLPNSLLTEQLNTITVDHSGLLWIGTELQGLHKYDKKFQYFAHFFHNPADSTTIVHNNVTSFALMEDSILWIGTQGGLMRYNRITKTHKAFVPSFSNGKNELSSYYITSLLYAHDGNLWIGTKRGLNIMNPHTEKVTQILHEKEKDDGIPHNEINYLYQSSDGTIWVGTKGGLARYQSATNNFKVYKTDKDNPNSPSNDNIQCIIEDKHGNIWYGTRAKGLDMFNPRTETFKNYNVDPSNPHSISHVIVQALHIDRNKNLWVGTKNGGLCRYDEKIDGFHIYREREGLASNLINAIVSDELGNLWISTNRGISRFNLTTERVKNFDVRDGLQGNEFNQGAFLRTEDGEVYFGGINGYNAFRPRDVRENAYEPRVVITDLYIHGKLVVPDAQDAILKKHISETKTLVLDYENNVFSFKFSAMHFVFPERNRYAYMLEGFDDEWIYTDAENRFATYTNLNPGTYTFKVKASNSDDIWSTESKSVRIIIKPPYWQTWWFKLLMVILVMSMAYLIYRWRIRRIQLRQIMLEKTVQERTAEIQKLYEESLRQKQQIEQFNNQLIEQQNELMEKSRRINEQNEEMKLINEQLKLQKEEIENQKAKIDSSIRYAKRIQEIMLPTPESLQAAFSDYFVYYKPKDVVSGDLYWYTHVKGKDIIAAIDCTGHGVPGAFMSMIADTLLDQIINIREITDPEAILMELNHGLVNLKHEKNQNQDGMDMAICVINKPLGIMEFAGAKNPLLVIDKYQVNGNGEAIHLYKGDKLPIGGQLRDKLERKYTKQVIKLSLTANYYIFSDGLQDQFGGPDGKKLSIRNIQALLLENYEAPMSYQQAVLDQLFNRWKGPHKQIDDITFIGFRI
ncbi:MAG: SpoIIE family protein phosphatase [Cytophagales bacterium]|nr:SpoIIE family protein phosphatase [Cytophagales bacterium]MDW8383887.1 two-component regulator propeller domain-containing protein [Flammeovirgaceae bacterium]